MRDSVRSTRYSSVCNVLRQWNIRLIPTLESIDSMIYQCMLFSKLCFPLSGKSLKDYNDDNYNNNHVYNA